MLKNQCTYIDDGCFLSSIECTTASLHSKAKFENNMVLRSLSFCGPQDFNFEMQTENIQKLINMKMLI